MRKKSISTMLALIMLASALAACGRASATDTEAVEKENATSTDVTEIMKDTEETAGESAQVEESMLKPAHSSSVVVSGDMAYYIGDEEIMSLNIKTGESNIVWVADSEYSDIYAFTSGSGIILQDKLYFTCNAENSDEDSYSITRRLNKIDLTTNSFETVAEFAADNYCTNNMYYADGILYTDLNGINDFFVVDEQGNVVKPMNRTEDAQYSMVPEGYTLPSYENGRKTLFPKECYSQMGKLILYNKESALVTYDPANGRETELGGYLTTMNDGQIVLCSYDQGQCVYGLINKKSGEYRFIARYDNSIGAIGVDNDYVYYAESDNDSGAANIYRMSLSDGKNSVIYTTPVSDSRLEVTVSYINSPVKIGDYVFTVESHDYGLYLAAINLEDNTMTVGDTCFYQSGVAGVGKLIRYSYSESSDDGQVLLNASSALLNVDDKYAGADKINELINSRQEEFRVRAESLVAEAQGYYDDAVEFAKEDGTGVYFIPYGLSEQVDDIDYLKDNIICFRVNGYDYYGGAHGMPYMDSYIFNLETGDRLSLDDFTNISEEELKDVVTAAFDKKMQVEGRDLYWDDAKETVHERITRDCTDIYLADDGVVFYFEPYLLASYAQGFIEVTISYDALIKPEDAK